MGSFAIYPAIDLSQGKVVCLPQGDPKRKIIYSEEPAAAAKRWIDEGARWLHVINVDGAFGEADEQNQTALEAILREATGRAQVQFGGGLRTLEAMRMALDNGIARVVVGTTAVEHPEVMKEALSQFGAERIAAGVDAMNGHVRVRGWQAGTQVSAMDLTMQLQRDGLRYLVFKDVDRDGMACGLNLIKPSALMRNSGLQVIVSGGVSTLEDIRMAVAFRLAGVVVGRALYEEAFSLRDALNVPNGKG